MIHLWEDPLNVKQFSLYGIVSISKRIRGQLLFSLHNLICFTLFFQQGKCMLHDHLHPVKVSV